MKTDRVFVLLLVVLLPLSGCFDGSTTGDAEGADAADDSSEGTTVINNYYNNTTTSSESQERTWYSSGNTYFTYWNDGQDAHSGEQRCLDWGPSYDSSTGEYIGETCQETGYPQQASDWNVTNCTERGGQIDWSGHSSTNHYRSAPGCKFAFTTITTSPGEALLIYQMSGFSMTSECMGVTVYTTSYLASGAGYAIAPGSALECTHELSQMTTYSTSDGTSYDYTDRQTVWSIVYAIQDTTVV
jgi:hypothetical protein